MTHEFLDTPPQARVEELLQDPQIQDGLRSVFTDLDNLYAGIKEQTPFSRYGYASSVTPDGIFVEASKVALPLPDKEATLPENEYKDQVAAHHASIEYLVFKFGLEDLKDPDFTLKPMSIREVVDYRGGGIDITEDNPDDPKPFISTTGFDNEGNEYTDEELDRLSDLRRDWSRRNVVHLPQVSEDTVRVGDIETEPFRDVRLRAGVEL